jgi:H-type small acid-soluble spore protein
MNSKRAEEIMQSYGVINVNYNGMPVWIEGVHNDVAEVTLIDMEKKVDVPISALTEADPIQTI